MLRQNCLRLKEYFPLWKNDKMLNVYFFKPKNITKTYLSTFVIRKNGTGGVRRIYREIQWLLVGKRGVLGLKGSYSGTRGMCKGEDRGLHEMRTRCWRGCTGDDKESTGKDREIQGIFLRLGDFRASSFKHRNSGRTAHTCGTASYLIHTVALLWNQSQVKSFLILTRNNSPNFFFMQKICGRLLMKINLCSFSLSMEFIVMINY